MTVDPAAANHGVDGTAPASDGQEPPLDNNRATVLEALMLFEAPSAAAAKPKPKPAEQGQEHRADAAKDAAEAMEVASVDEGPPPPPPPRSELAGKRIVGCQVPGCTERDLSALKPYYQRYKICQFHGSATEVQLNGAPHRFCQQCGRFHPIKEFDRLNHSCRARLLTMKKRRQRKMDAKSAPATDKLLDTSLLLYDQLLEVPLPFVDHAGRMPSQASGGASTAGFDNFPAAPSQAGAALAPGQLAASLPPLHQQQQHSPLGQPLHGPMHAYRPVQAQAQGVALLPSAPQQQQQHQQSFPVMLPLEVAVPLEPPLEVAPAQQRGFPDPAAGEPALLPPTSLKQLQEYEHQQEHLQAPPLPPQEHQQQVLYVQQPYWQHSQHHVARGPAPALRQQQQQQQQQQQSQHQHQQPQPQLTPAIQFAQLLLRKGLRPLAPPELRDFLFSVRVDQEKLPCAAPELFRDFFAAEAEVEVACKRQQGLLHMVVAARLPGEARHVLAAAGAPGLAEHLLRGPHGGAFWSRLRLEVQVDKEVVVADQGRLCEVINGATLGCACAKPLRPAIEVVRPLCLLNGLPAVLTAEGDVLEDKAVSFDIRSAHRFHRVQCVKQGRRPLPMEREAADDDTGSRGGAANTTTAAAGIMSSSMSDNNHAIAQEAIESGSAASQGQAQQEYIEFGMLRVGAAFSAPDSDDIDGPAVELAGSPPPRSFTARVQAYRGQFTSNAKPLFVTDCPMALEEVLSLEEEPMRFFGLDEESSVDLLLVELGAALKHEDATASDVPRALAPTLYNLLCVACDRGWPQVTTRLLALAAKIDDAEAWRDCLDEEARRAAQQAAQAASMAAPHAQPQAQAQAPLALTLLQRAVAASSRGVVHVLLPWAAAHAAHPLAAEACPMTPGPFGVTALHLAALLPDGGRIAMALTGNTQAYVMWLTSQDHFRMTPTEYVKALAGAPPRH